MTFAPATILAVRAFLKGEDPDLSDPELGIVGGPSHVATGTSYHLGRDQLILSKNPYSARTARDKAGLSNAASAIDIDDDLDELRPMSAWMVRQCQTGAPDAIDIREIIFSPDGVNVLRYDRERGQSSAPIPDSDISHRSHTHVSYYRDSEFRDKVGLYQRYFEGEDMATRYEINSDQYWWETTRDQDPIKGITLGDGSNISVPNLPLQRFKRIEAMLTQLSMPQPVPVDITALVAALSPVIREIVREELNNTRLGGA